MVISIRTFHCTVEVVIVNTIWNCRIVYDVGKLGGKGYTVYYVCVTLIGDDDSMCVVYVCGGLKYCKVYTVVYVRVEGRTMEEGS